MPTTSAAAAKSFRGARLITFLYKARRRCRATYHSMHAGRLLLRISTATVLVSMPAPPPSAPQAQAGKRLAPEAPSSASDTPHNMYPQSGYWHISVRAVDLCPAPD